MKIFAKSIRCHLASAFIVGAFSIMIASPLFAQSGQGMVKWTSTATADLVGNGKQEAISVRAVKKADSIASFTLTVGAAKMTVSQTDGMDECKGLRIVQVDGSSRSRQIIVALGGADDIEADYLFGFDGSHLFKIGRLDSSGDVPGNGAIYTTRWMDFWSATEKYVVNLKDRRLQNVAQPLYAVTEMVNKNVNGLTVTATASFPTLRDRSAASPTVATVAPGSRFSILVFAPDRPGELLRGEPGWYLLKTQTGLCGWARIETFHFKQKGLDFAD